MRCFRCQAEITLSAGERVGFRDECTGCGNDLHVCRNCVHHDPGAYNECRESSAERVGDRERANRCEYFSAAAAAPGGGDEAGGREATLEALDALFTKD